MTIPHRFDRRALALMMVLALPATAAAQMPGLPVLQNAFVNPGITVAINAGYSEDAIGYGAAAAWAPASGRFVLSAGAGAVSPDEGQTAAAAGARVSMPVKTFLEDALGVAVFAGAGGASRDEWRQIDLPVGIGIGWRRAFGVSRGISVHAAPMVRWTRNSIDGGSSTSATLFRVSAGVDVTLGTSFGVTLGVESGGRDVQAAPALARNVGGIGVSYVFR